VKKLISIGLALAILGMVVLPVSAAAYTPYQDPGTYAKIPFAIVASGFGLLQAIWPDLDVALGMDMPWLADVFGGLADWAFGPLSWTVDMLAWGLGVGGSVMAALSTVIELPFDVAELLNTIACACFAPFGNVTGAEWNPCPTP
jgi:hypothetical protein